MSLSWASSIQSIPPHPTSWRSILILSSHLRLGLPSGFFPSGFLTITLYTPLLFLKRATCSAHLILDFITRTILGEAYRSLSSSLCNFLYSPVTPSLLGPNIFLNTLFSNTLSLCSSLNVSDQVSSPYKTTDTLLLIKYQIDRTSNILNFIIMNIYFFFSFWTISLSPDEFLVVLQNSFVTVLRTVHAVFTAVALHDGYIHIYIYIYIYFESEDKYEYRL